MTYPFLFYCFLSVVLVSGGAYFLFSNGQQTTAAIYFVGALVASIFFATRWFKSSGLTNNAGPWPPVINYCPDFLTLNTIAGEQVCVDTIGVAQSGGLEKWSDPTQTDEKFLFHLYLNESGNDRLLNLCEEAKTKRVSWEGVWNGSACMGVEPPKPSSPV